MVESCSNPVSIDSFHIRNHCSVLKSNVIVTFNSFGKHLLNVLSNKAVTRCFIVYTLPTAALNGSHLYEWIRYAHDVFFYTRIRE